MGVFTFLKARGVSVGSSLVEDDQLELATKLEAIAKEKGVELFLTGLGECNTVIWNGPMDVFEMDAFAKGTFGVADTHAELTGKGCVTIIGGGDSVAAVEKAGLADKMSHISTGGGASLELLEGKVLPGVAALNEV